MPMKDQTQLAEACGQVTGCRVFKEHYRRQNENKMGKEETGGTALFPVNPFMFVTEDARVGGPNGSACDGEGAMHGFNETVVWSDSLQWDGSAEWSDYSSIGDFGADDGLDLKVLPLVSSAGGCNSEVKGHLCAVLGCEEKQGRLGEVDGLLNVKVMENVRPVAVDCLEFISHIWVKDNVVGVAEMSGVAFGDHKARGDALLLKLVGDREEEEVTCKERAIVVHRPSHFWKGEREVWGLAFNVNYDGKSVRSRVRGRGGARRRDEGTLIVSK